MGVSVRGKVTDLSVEYNGLSLTTFMSPPPRHLSEFIEYYYGEEAVLSDYSGEYMPHQVVELPAAGVGMHFCYHDTTFTFKDNNKRVAIGSSVTGPHNLQTPFVVSDFKKVCKVIHIKFRPGGFFRLFRIPESEIKNTFYELPAVIGNEIRSIENRLNDCASTAERILILDNYFSRKIKYKSYEASMENVLAATSVIVEAGGRKRIREVMRQLHVAKRTLDRQFISWLGLTPKEFSRVVRFKDVMNSILGTNNPDWCGLAETHGYYDQAHLIDEFKTATSIPPDSFVKHSGRSIVRFRTGLFITMLTRPIDDMPSSYRELMRETIQNDEKVRKLI